MGVELAIGMGALSAYSAYSSAEAQNDASEQAQENERRRYLLQL